MSYDNLSSVSQNVLKFYQQLTGEEKNRQKRKGSSSLHQLAADKILKDSKKHNSSYRTT
jgi:hypothetical protein